MSDSPIVFKRTKPKPSQRPRSIVSKLQDDTQPSSAEVTGTDEESHSMIAAKVKKQRKRPKSALSFGGDDEDGQGEVFQAKKSSLSRKLALGRAAVLPGSVPSSPPVANESPRYDAKYLSELKASMRSSRPAQPEAQTNDMSYDADTSIVNDISFDGASLDSIDTSLVTDTPEMEIPTYSYIIDAKKKRDALRKTGGTSEDFISLSVTKRDNNLGPHPESRLVREEDELGEADDEFAEFTSAQERIALGKKARKLEASKRKEMMQAAIDETQEDDAEEMEWEQEQLRRGGNRGYPPESQVPVKAVYKPAPIPLITPIPTLDPAVSRITHSLTTLTTSHAQNTSSLNSLAEEQMQLEAKEKELREMIERTEAKRSWFVAFRGWVEEVANFLDDKFPQLERLEDEHISLLKERSDMISDRRRKDDEDDLTLFFGELSRSVEEQSTPSTRQQRSAARIQRRLQRRGIKPPFQTTDEGYSTDSSLPPSESQDFQTALAKLEDKVGDVLSDVRAEGFRDPNVGLKKWFGEWRENFEDIYVGAWGGLGLTGAWEFWARLEIMGWNPFEDDRSFDSFDFYRSLHEYSRSFRAEKDQTEGDSELGPEGDLASSMISTAVVPRLCKLIEGGSFDPFSAKDVRTMIDLAEQVEIAVQDRTNLKFQMLLKSVSVVFQNAVNAEKLLLESYLNVNRPRFDPDAIPARNRYLNRRIKLIEGIVKWRKYTGEKFGLGDVVKRIVDEILIPVAEGGWEVGGEQCLRKVAKVLPQELITPGLETRLQ